MLCYLSLIAYPGVAQLVARLTGGQEAVSSSLATRTRLVVKGDSPEAAGFSYRFGRLSNGLYWAKLTTVFAWVRWTYLFTMSNEV